MEITDHFGIQALSRASYAKLTKLSSTKSIFEDFPGPWKMEEIFKNLHGLSRKRGHDVGHSEAGKEFQTHGWYESQSSAMSKYVSSLINYNRW